MMALVTQFFLVASLPHMEHYQAKVIRHAFSVEIRHVVFGKWRNLTIEASAAQRDGPSYLRHWGGDRFRLSFYEVRGTRKKLVRASSEPSGAAHCDYLRFGVYKGVTLLAVSGNGGQYEYVTVYRINPTSLSTTLASDPIIEGDARLLSSGSVIERCPDQYVQNKPNSFRRLHKNVAELIIRPWHYDEKLKWFLPAKFLYSGHPFNGSE
jgi:hypothetical protein